MYQNFNHEKMHTYLKGYAVAKHWKDTIASLNFSRKQHAMQKRKNGEPYIVHPLTMASHAVACGIDDDTIIASILLHDVVEDCGISIHDLPCSKSVKEIVSLLTYVKPEDATAENIAIAKQQYYDNISKNGKASIVKLFDRCHNLSTMSGVFSKVKVMDYIEETERYVLPLLKSTKENFPEYQDILFVLKYHILSILDAVEGTVKTYGYDVV